MTRERTLAETSTVLLFTTLLLCAAPVRPAAIDDALGARVIESETRIARGSDVLWHLTATTPTLQRESLYFWVDARGAVAQGADTCTLQGTVEVTDTGWRLTEGLFDCLFTVKGKQLEVEARAWWDVNPKLFAALSKRAAGSQVRDWVVQGVPGGKVVAWAPGAESLQVVDASDGAPDDALTAQANEALRQSSYASCREYNHEPLLAPGIDQLSCGDGGTALMSYFCRFDDSAIPTCGEEVGRRFSPAQFAEPETQELLAREGCDQEARAVLALTESVEAVKRRLEARDVAGAVSLCRQSPPERPQPDALDTACGATDDALLHRSVDLWAEWLNNYGFALFKAGDLRQASVVLERAADFVAASRRERPVLTLNQGEVWCALGDHARGAAALEQFLSSKLGARQRAYAKAVLKRCR